METPQPDWTPIEIEVARKAFDLAYTRDIAALVCSVRQSAEVLSTPDQIWTLHDYLSAKRHEMDGKYEFACPRLLIVFADLVRDHLLEVADLEGLGREKIAKISALSRLQQP